MKTAALLAAWLLLLACGPAIAQERIPFRHDEGELGAMMWRSILVMAVLVVLALGVIYVMRRRGIGPAALRVPSAGGMRVVQSVRLGAHATLVVVEFEGQRLLIGQGERGVNVLASAPLAAAGASPLP